MPTPHEIDREIQTIKANIENQELSLEAKQLQFQYQQKLLALEAAKAELAAQGDIKISEEVYEKLINYSKASESIDKLYEESLVKAQLSLADIEDVNKVDDKGWTILHRVAQKGNVDAVEILLMQPDIEVNKVTNLGDTPLIKALKKPHNVEVVRLFMDNLEVQQWLKDSEYPIVSLAIELSYGSWEIVELLLSYGADINNISAHSQIWSDYETATFLLDHGANVNASRSYYGALNLAVTFQNIPLINLLLDRGADINQADKSGRVPLENAVLKNNKDIVELLLDRGADTNKVVRGVEETPLFTAVKMGFIELARLLLDRGADINKAALVGNTPYFIAVKKGFVDIAIMLLDRGADVNEVDKDGHTFLHRVTETGNKEAVELLLARPEIDCNKFNKYGETPLSIAVYNGHKEVVELLLSHSNIVINYLLKDNAKFVSHVYMAVLRNINQLEILNVLLDHGAYINADRDDQTALHLAVNSQNIPLINLLLDRGADINKADKCGRTPIQSAVLQNNKDIVELLLDRGADVNKVVRGVEETPLFGAVKRGFIEIARLLLDRGAYINASADGQTALRVAVNSQNIPLINLLLDRGADINKADKFGCTPLHKAVDTNKNNKDVIELLLKYGADVNSASSYYTVLSLAVKQSFRDIITLLLDHPGIEVDKKASDGRTALHEAVNSQNIPLINLLLDRGADINKAYKCGRTPIQSAVLQNNKDIVELLLDRGAEVNKDDTSKVTLLLCAVNKGYIDIVRLLLDRGADINKADNSGRTPLQGAIQQNNKDIVELLLKHPNIEVNKADNSGRTPIQSAVLQNNKDIVELLLKHPNIEVNKGDNNGYTPLLKAVSYSNIDIIESLLKHGADVNGESSNNIALYISVKQRSDIISLLLDNTNIQVSKQDDAANTAFHIAAAIGRQAIIELLLDHQDVKISMKVGYGSYIVKTIVNGYQGFIELLLQHPSIEVNKVYTYSGYSPLFMAIQSGNVDITELLLKNGADVNSASGSGTALHLGVKQKSEIVKLLLDHPDIEVNKKNDDGNTALHIMAAFIRNTVKMKLLLDHPDIEVNKKDSAGNTALHIIIVNGYQESIDLLLKYGADINDRNSNGDTPLMLAKAKGFNSIVTILENKLLQEAAAKRLLDSKISLSVETTDPLIEKNKKDEVNSIQTKLVDVSEASGYQGFLKLLLKRGADVNDRNIKSVTSLIKNLDSIVTILENKLLQVAEAKQLLNSKTLLSAESTDLLIEAKHEIEDTSIQTKLVDALEDSFSPQSVTNVELSQFAETIKLAGKVENSFDLVES